MKVDLDVAGGRRMSSAWIFAGFILVLLPFAPTAGAQSQPAETKPAETKARTETYQTIYLNYATQQSDLADVQTALRNMLPNLRIYAEPGQKAISMRATAEDLLLAREIIADLDRPKKIYRLNFTITESGGGRHTGAQQIVLVADAGQRAMFRQRLNVPLVASITKTGTAEATTPEPQEAGLSIEATVERHGDGLSLHTLVHQCSIDEEKSAVGAQNPAMRDIVLENNSTLQLGKPLVLGSFELPGGTRKQEIEVVAELVK